ncbi:MAG: lactonase family protein [Planctomycetota bacterium]|jgi:6-phosphogluconolactonase (cycloisomerase 2 family)
MISPDGASGREQIGAFGVDAGGALASLVGSPYLTTGDGNRNSKASGMVATPDRRFVVVTHNTSKLLESFETDVNGNLRPISTVTLTSDAGDLAIHPNGTVIYASLGNASQVAVVQIDATTGVLRNAANSPITVGSSVRDLDVDPSGQYLATGHMFGTDRGVKVFPLDATGMINGAAVDQVSLGGRAGASVQYGRLGTLLFVRELDGGVYAFQSNLGNGKLTRVNSTPFSVGGFSTTMVVHPTGDFVYVGRGNGVAELHGFRVDGTGALAALPGSPFALPSGNYQKMTMSKAGDRIYLSERSTLSVVGYNVSGTSGLVSQIAAPWVVPGTSSATSPRIVPHSLLLVD